jgi:hypothetical protein
MKAERHYQMSPYTWLLSSVCSAIPFLTVYMSLQVLVPLDSSIPRPYTSTAHLPTPFIHRVESTFSMTKYAQRLEQQTGQKYPPNPPGEPQWPSFLQVLVNPFQIVLKKFK